MEIDKGAPNGDKYVIHGEGDQIPDAEAGDVIVQIKQSPHKNFQRKGADLFMEKEITLLEALTGVDFVLTHLDGRKIRIKNTPGEVIKPDDVKTVEHLGMPFAKRSYTFGNLFIHFKIKFPATVDNKTLGLIQDALGEGAKAGSTKNRKKSEEAKSEDGKADEVCEMKNFEEFHRNTHHGGGTAGNESDEDEDDHGHGGQRVGCQSQ